MTSKTELETIILVNQADLLAGYWHYGTSDPSVARIVTKKFKDNILSVKESKSAENGKITYWDFKLRADCLRRKPFLAPKSRQILSDRQREDRRSRLGVLRAKQNRGRAENNE